MRHQMLPRGLKPKGSSPTFSEESIPPALLEAHALGAGRWGVLHLLQGRALFVDLETGDEHGLAAPARVTIAPQAPHALRLDGPMNCRIDFFEEAGDGSGKRITRS